MVDITRSVCGNRNGIYQKPIKTFCYIIQQKSIVVIQFIAAARCRILRRQNVIHARQSERFIRR